MRLIADAADVAVPDEPERALDVTDLSDFTFTGFAATEGHAAVLTGLLSGEIALDGLEIGQGR